MGKYYLLLKLIPKLGIFNVVYAAWYKLSLKYGLRKKWFKIGVPVVGKYYFETTAIIDYPADWQQQTIAKANKICEGTFTWFSYHDFEVGKIPNWFYNPFDKSIHTQQKKHWTEINDFGEGDIKITWELSRFDWLTDLARAYAITNNQKYLININALLEDWSKHNPQNIGPNWKCGQETSFRLMKMLTAACLFQQNNKPSDQLIELIQQHVQRIEGNITYGIVQDNNHGSSEAIALYIGATWLVKNGSKSTYLNSYKNKGRKLLIGRIKKLIQPDGTFSQRSLTYHRVLIDTLSFCLHMMQLTDEPPFDEDITKRLISLGEWQYKMTFGDNGDGPNFGSNDGAMIENLCNNGYRDFRPSTQLFFALLTKQRIYDDINISEAMFWRCGPVSLAYPLKNIDLPEAEILDNQLLIIRNQRAKLLLKIPEDTFRPGNDAFHIDLWIDGKPVLIDAGTYSYNSGEFIDAFKSVESHNTIQFSNFEQMPKISRFLNGAWIKPSFIGPIQKRENTITWRGIYIDYLKNKHEREITLDNNSLTIQDKVHSRYSSFCRFHIVNEDMIKCKNVHYENFIIPTKNKTEASLYYMEKHTTSVIELAIRLKFDSIKFHSEYYNQFLF